MILQLGVKPSWFNTCSISSDSDLRSYMIDSPSIGDTVVPELLLKVLEPYRKEGCLCSLRVILGLKLFNPLTISSFCCFRLPIR